VIARHYQAGCRDGFERLALDVRLLDHHAGHLERALAAGCVAIGAVRPDVLDLIKQSMAAVAAS
jgi:hypothetical protein